MKIRGFKARQGRAVTGEFRQRGLGCRASGFTGFRAQGVGVEGDRVEDFTILGFRVWEGVLLQSQTDPL